MKPRFSLLRQEASDLPEGGADTAAVTPPAAPAAPEAEPEKKEEETPAPAPAPAAPAEPAEKRPTLLQLAEAAVSSKASLIRESASLRSRLEAAETERDGLALRLEKLQASVREDEVALSQLRAERSDLEKALLAARSEAKSAEETAVDIVAGQFGVEPGKLPEAAIPGESREELMAALDAEKDPAKRFQLAARINAL
jgi:hypothetical protein